MEWNERHKYNSFNSYKGLAYAEHYRKVVDWMNQKTDAKLPPPIECSLDPIAKCNLKCYYCNSRRYLRDNPDEIPKMNRSLSKKYMERFIDFLSKWGVKGICFGGGGESTLSQNMWGLMSYASARRVQPSIVTNGTVMTHALLRDMMYCRWVGFSVDAATPETYEAIKGVNAFQTVIDNIKKFVEFQNTEHWGIRDITFKFLISPENQNEIYRACKIAKDIGCTSFHARPVDLNRKDFPYKPETEYDYDNIQRQFDLCCNLDDGKFGVFTVQHKFDEKLNYIHNFERCLASPLVLQACTDGGCYVCVDHRVEERFRLGSHYSEPSHILQWWGSDAHRELIKSIKPSEECARCTWCEYNRQIEEVIINDEMCLNFP